MTSKLVRDGIPALMLAKGETLDRISLAPSSQLTDLLLAKLSEEAEEVRDCLCLEELADVLQVIHNLCYLKLWSLNDLEAVRHGKEIARGGFTKSYVLELDTE